jgi:hypothetical protein
MLLYHRHVNSLLLCRSSTHFASTPAAFMALSHSPLPSREPTAQSLVSRQLPAAALYIWCAGHAQGTPSARYWQQDTTARPFLPTMSLSNGQSLLYAHYQPQQGTVSAVLQHISFLPSLLEQGSESVMIWRSALHTPASSPFQSPLAFPLIKFLILSYCLSICLASKDLNRHNLLAPKIMTESISYYKNWKSFCILLVPLCFLIYYQGRIKRFLSRKENWRLLKSTLPFYRGGSWSLGKVFVILQAFTGHLWCTGLWLNSIRERCLEAPPDSPPVSHLLGSQSLLRTGLPASSFFPLPLNLHTIYGHNYLSHCKPL